MKKLISLMVMVLALNGCGEDKKFTYGSADNTETMIGLGHANDVDIDINYMVITEVEEQIEIYLAEANKSSRNLNGLIFRTDSLPNLASAIKAAADDTRRFSVQQYHISYLGMLRV
ncbi:hypothetical protein [Vibrio sp. MA40-2]|uniref:hypothetical protein n=1 Tax=Vibrio sp. MA40-2 TaxID=3391828 RepID=UPI0039A6B873